MKAAIFLPNWVGDVAMATPALRALRQHWGPEAHIVGVMKPYVREVLDGTTWLNDVILHDAKKQGRWTASARLISQLRSERFDVAVLLNSSLATAVCAWLAGCKTRLGFARNGRGLFLTHTAKEPHRSSPEFTRSTVDQYLEIAELITPHVNNRRLELATTQPDREEADRILRALGWSMDAKYVVLNNGGAFGPSKNWPTEHFADLARTVAEQLHRKVLLLCGPAEREIAQKTAALASHSEVKAYTQSVISLGASKELVRRAQAMVTTDTGPRHFASAFEVPSVVLFGPIPSKLSYNYAPTDNALSLNLDCSPCMKRECPLGHHRCMRDLTPASVFSALKAAIETKERRGAQAA